MYTDYDYLLGLLIKIFGIIFILKMARLSFIFNDEFRDIIRNYASPDYAYCAGLAWEKTCEIRKKEKAENRLFLWESLIRLPSKRIRGQYIRHDKYFKDNLPEKHQARHQLNCFAICKQTKLAREGRKVSISEARRLCRESMERYRELEKEVAKMC